MLLWLWLAGAEGDRAAAVTAGVAAVLGLLGAAAISSVVTLPRPFMDGSAVNYLDHVRDGSFPSDHATFMFALAFALLLRRPPMLPRVWVPLLAAAVAVGWARVFLNTHYPWDIVGGALLGACAAALATAPPVRPVLRRLDALGEGSRSLAIARWRRTGRGPPAKDQEP